MLTTFFKRPNILSEKDYPFWIKERSRESFLYKKRMCHADTPSFVFVEIKNYMRSGTSMPRSDMALLMILATFLASMRRTARLSASGSLRIE